AREKTRRDIEEAKKALEAEIAAREKAEQEAEEARLAKEVEEQAKMQPGKRPNRKRKRPGWLKKLRSKLR
ncbi:MAG: hypothetical protein QF432_05575, partial [Dehalococcoidales bacterium]|nr:hypothetical protein [Dehalococcoidales bacterium]